MAQQYEPAEYEAKIYQQWEDSHSFQPDLSSEKTPFVVMLPPPNITGSLHLGHALQDTIIDILIRHHRLLGEPTLWLPGTDHAALPTNKIIVEQLAAEGKTKEEIGREEFLRRTAAWYQSTGAQIIHQMKRLGCSCDWSRTRFTLDDAYYRSVQTAFVEYHKAGYLYRAPRLVNWDPATQTTVSDLEIDWHTEQTPFYTLQYGPFKIGTARPETKFGDKYVVMHPEDQRYANYQHGQTISLEWINGPITATIIKDEAVDPGFGTGVMTITPWHDATDFDLAQRHNLDMQQIIDFNGQLLPVAGDFAGLTVADARPRVVAKLQQKNLLVSVDDSYEHNLALNDRGKGVIEPQVMRQWFLDMSRLKEPTLAAAEQGQLEFLPPRWKKHFLNWMHGVRDWNINRQIWLGHRLPVWWRPGTHGTDNEEGNYIVSINKPDDRAGLPAEASGAGWEQDPDVLDTWFSSALWPFATLGWPEGTPDLAKFYPTSLLVTARDILYLWVARMVFSGLEFLHQLPFRQVLIHPTVLTKDGRRMSKSLGTGLDPLELIDRYGADATRFGLIYQMNYDQQALKFDEEALKSARNFTTKLWNMARLLESLPVRSELSLADHWLQTRLHEVQQALTAELAAGRVGEAARRLYAFTWDDYAAWYLEILKEEGSTVFGRDAFRQLLQLLHPFLPFITEVLWQRSGAEGLLINAAWPSTSAGKPADLTVFQEAVTLVRALRAQAGLKPTAKLNFSTPSSLPLPRAFQRLTGTVQVSAVNQPALSLKLANSLELTLAFTPEQQQSARTKLTQARELLAHQLEKQSAILVQMQGRAPDSKLKLKQAALAELKVKLAAVDKNLQLLGPV
jgi:valyl-tRNA synthetase